MFGPALPYATTARPSRCKEDAKPKTEAIDPIIYSLRARRIELGISQALLGAQLGVPPASISDWERAFYSPTLRTLRRWADALDMTLIASVLPVEARDKTEV